MDTSTSETKADPNVPDVSKDAIPNWGMDRATGVIRALKESAPLQTYEYPVFRRPNPKCNKCYGRGYVGRSSASNKRLGAFVQVGKTEDGKPIGAVVACSCTFAKQPIASWRR